MTELIQKVKTMILEDKLFTFFVAMMAGYFIALLYIVIHCW